MIHLTPVFLFKALKTCPEEAKNTDFLKIAECLDLGELQRLCEHLGVSESDLNRVKFNYEKKGIAEVTMILVLCLVYFDVP